MLMRKIYNNRGSATILGLGITLLLGMILAALLPWITAESRFSGMEKDGLQAKYAAEAGVKRALVESQLATRVWTLFDNTNRQFTNNSGDNVWYRVSLTELNGAVTSSVPPVSSGDYIIRATGTTGSTSRIAGRLVNIQVLPGRIGMYVGGSFNFKNNLSIGDDTIIEMSGQVCNESGTSCITCPPSNPANYSRCGCDASGQNCTALTGITSPGSVTLATSGYTTPLASFNPATSGKYYAANWTNSSNSNPINFTLTGSNQNVGIYIAGDLGNTGTNSITFSTGSGTNNTLVVYVDGNVYGKNNFTIDGAVVVIKGGFKSEFNNLSVSGLLVVDDANPVTINNVETKNNPSFTFDAAAIANVSALGLTLPNEYTTLGVTSVTPGSWVKLQ